MHEAWFDASIKEDGTTIISGIIKSNEEIIIKYAEQIKKRTSIKAAEYMSLIELLRKIKENGIEHVTIYGDCKDVINPINGIVYKNRHNRYKTAKKMLSETKSVVCWVKRSKNKEADNLAQRKRR